MNVLALIIAMVSALGVYPMGATVVETDRVSDTVIIEESNGNTWAFQGVEDWAVGDGVACIMHDNGTPKWVYDDIIVDVRYTG